MTNRLVMPSTPAIPFPVVPQEPASHDEAPAPRWCVRRFPTVGSDSITLIGFDGESYPKAQIIVPLDDDLEFWERVILSRLSARREGRLLRPSVLPSRLNLLP